MRAIFAAFLLLLLPIAAQAAPTCQNLKGDTVRCGTQDAMPVGWTPSPKQLLQREISRPPSSHTHDILEALAGIGLLFLLIALLPEFDGSPAGGGWDRQEDDEDDKPGR